MAAAAIKQITCYSCELDMFVVVVGDEFEESISFCPVCSLEVDSDNVIDRDAKDLDDYIY